MNLHSLEPGVVVFRRRVNARTTKQGSIYFGMKKKQAWIEHAYSLPVKESYSKTICCKKKNAFDGYKIE